MALGLSKSLVKFFSSFKPPLELIIKVYERVLCPVLEFGIKASAFTKSNRSMLRKYERLIVAGLLTCVENHLGGKNGMCLVGEPLLPRFGKLEYGIGDTSLVENPVVCSRGHFLTRRIIKRSVGLVLLGLTR